jgi:hypothetical protein
MGSDPNHGLLKRMSSSISVQTTPAHRIGLFRALGYRAKRRRASSLKSCGNVPIWNRRATRSAPDSSLSDRTDCECGIGSGSAVPG